MKRRDFLKTSAAATTASIAGCFDIRADSNLEDLMEAVDHRAEVAEENPGSSILFGNPNQSLDTMKAATVGPRSALEEELDDMTPREVAEELPGRTKLWENGHWHNFFLEKQLNMKVVHMDEGEHRPEIDTYIEVAEGSFNRLLPENYNVNIAGETVEPDKEDIGFLKNAGEDFSDLELSIKYSEDDQVPVYLTGRDVKDHSSGYANQMEGASYVELNEDENSNIATTIHELGHLALFLPHTYLESGVMSYNDDAGNDTGFGEASQMIVDAMVAGEEDYIYDGTVIDIEYNPEDIDKDDAERYVRENVDAFVSKYLEEEADEVILGEEKSEVIYDLEDQKLHIEVEKDLRNAYLE